MAEILDIVMPAKIQALIVEELATVEFSIDIPWLMLSHFKRDRQKYPGINQATDWFCDSFHPIRLEGTVTNYTDDDTAAVHDDMFTSPRYVCAVATGIRPAGSIAFKSLRPDFSPLRKDAAKLVGYDDTGLPFVRRSYESKLGIQQANNGEVMKIVGRGDLHSRPLLLPGTRRFGLFGNAPDFVQ